MIKCNDKLFKIISIGALIGAGGSGLTAWQCHPKYYYISSTPAAMWPNDVPVLQITGTRWWSRVEVYSRMNMSDRHGPDGFIIVDGSVAILRVAGWPFDIISETLNYTKDSYVMLTTSGNKIYTILPRKPASTRYAWHWFGMLANVVVWLTGLLLIRHTLGWVVAAVKRLRRSRPGKCSDCNYDLSGLSVSRCPECGFTSSKDNLLRADDKIKS